MALQRVYTEKSLKLMKYLRRIVLLVLSPIWVPLMLISVLGFWLEDVLDFFDKKLIRILDRITPHIK